jgi:hypothetical protein
VDARRRVPALQNAPQVLYSIREPPMELRHLNLKDSDDISYVTFGKRKLFFFISLRRIFTFVH